jgi:hypothetical protein
MGKNIFNSVQLEKPKKNVFDLSHDVKMSMKMGNLTPVLVTECVPGDSFQIGCDSLIRFAPMVAPVMHRMDVSVHYFFVPNRILWDNWEKFIVDANTQHVLPFISSQYLEPQYAASTGSSAKNADYLGVPTPANGSTSVNINMLPFAAYQAIYNEYYRDENLIPEVDYKLTDGDNSPTFARLKELCEIRQRAWEHDYFTASLPFAQKGSAVDIPIGSIDNDVAVNWNSLENAHTAVTYDGTNSQTIGSSAGVSTSGTPEMIAKTSDIDIQPTTINDLRRAFRLQEWLEKNARGGTRYIENILMHFGVRSSDKRLQRPEYITGLKTPVIISEVLNTSATTTEPQGNMAGHGVAVSTGKYGNYFCEEHGYIIGIMSVMPQPAYQQGIPKTYLKTDPLDFFWPSFAHIGEQPVQNNELYAYTATGEDTFGYVPRYAEYKYQASRVAADFRNLLDYWHLGRKFATQPALNKAFIECTPEQVERIFAVQDGEDNLYCQIMHKIKAVRPMPKFGTPNF